MKTRKIIFVLLLFFFCYNLVGQVYERKTNESAESFVKRIYNAEELAHPVIETKEWDSSRKVIICFRLVSVPEDDDRIVGNILVPVNENSYKQILIDSFYYIEGGMRSRTIETVFFANADKDRPREIFIQTRAEAYSPRYADRDVDGYYYDIFVYDNPDILSPQKKLLQLTAMTAKFSDEFEGEIYEKTSNGNDEKLVKKKKAKYKTADAVRVALKQMGY